MTSPQGLTDTLARHALDLRPWALGVSGGIPATPASPAISARGHRAGPGRRPWAPAPRTARRWERDRREPRSFSLTARRMRSPCASGRWECGGGEQNKKGPWNKAFYFCSICEWAVVPCLSKHIAARLRPSSGNTRGNVYWGARRYAEEAARSWEEGVAQPGSCWRAGQPI